MMTTMKDAEQTDWRDTITSKHGWQQIGMIYVMEWQMVWKDVLIGFTVAGIISAFVPDRFFDWLFIGSASGGALGLGFTEVLLQTLAGPLAAFFTFIGSMGNIPLAALLFDHGVSFAGVMAFIFSDLVVFPVLRINAEYYGWKMAFYLLGLMLTCLVAASLVMHYGFAYLDMLPEPGTGSRISDRDMFALNYGAVLNIVFLIGSVILGWLWLQGKHEMEHDHQHDHGGVSLTDRLLLSVAALAGVWLIGGLIITVTGFAS